jgi:hypothetical protein
MASFYRSEIVESERQAPAKEQDASIIEAA